MHVMPITLNEPYRGKGLCYTLFDGFPKQNEGNAISPFMSPNTRTAQRAQSKEQNRIQHAASFDIHMPDITEIREAKPYPIDIAKQTPNTPYPS